MNNKTCENCSFLHFHDGTAICGAWKKEKSAEEIKEPGPCALYIQVKASAEPAPVPENKRQEDGREEGEKYVLEGQYSMFNE